MVFLVPTVLQPTYAQTNQPITMKISFQTNYLTVTPQGNIDDPNIDASTLTITWNWGDGTSQTATGWPKDLKHQYQSTGSYPVTVKVVDNLGNTNTYAKIVTV